MIENINPHGEKELIVSTTGKFGKATTNITIENDVFEDKDKWAVDKFIQRFSHDGKILAEILIETSLDNTEETIHLYASLASDTLNIPCSLSLMFHKYPDDYGCGLGFFGRRSREKIPKEIYSKIRSEIIDICNPDLDFTNDIFDIFSIPQIDTIMNLLYECNNVEINELLEYWNDAITEERDVMKKQLKKSK